AGLGPQRRPRRGRSLPPGRRGLRRRPQPGDGQAAGRDPAGLSAARNLELVHPDVAAELKDLSTTLESIEAVTDLAALRAEIADLSEQAGRPDLWNDPEAAQKVNSRLSHAQGDLRRIEELRRRLDDLPVLYELAEEEGSAAEVVGALADADAERAKLRDDIQSLEVRTLLSGEYDA